MKRRHWKKPGRRSASLHTLRVREALLLVCVSGGLMFAVVYVELLRVIALVGASGVLVATVIFCVWYAIRFARRVAHTVLLPLQRFIRFRPYFAAGIRQLTSLPPKEFDRFIRYVLEAEGYQISTSHYNDPIIHAHATRAGISYALHVRPPCLSSALTYAECAAIVGAAGKYRALIVTTGRVTDRAYIFAMSRGVVCIAGARLMWHVWHARRRRRSFFDVLLSPVLRAPEQVKTPPLFYLVRSLATGGQVAAGDSSQAGCARFWPELCKR